jgi:predicted heme/steroid binding protein
MWTQGQHYEHWAGQDLTEELKDAPHDKRVFRKYKIIGILDKTNS